MKSLDPGWLRPQTPAGTVPTTRSERDLQRPRRLRRVVLTIRLGSGCAGCHVRLVRSGRDRVSVPERAIGARLTATDLGMRGGDDDTRSARRG